MEISPKNPKTIAVACVLLVVAGAIFYFVSRESTKVTSTPSGGIRKVSAETEDPSTLVGIKNPSAPQVIKGVIVTGIFAPSTQVIVKSKYSCVDGTGKQINWGYHTFRTFDEETIAAVRPDLICSVSIASIEPTSIDGKSWDTPTFDRPLYYVYGGVKNQLLKINMKTQ